MRSVTSGYRDVLGITTKDYIIFQKVTSPKVGMNPFYLSNHKHIRCPGNSIPGQPDTELFFPTLGRGDCVFHQDVVVRGIIQDDEGV